MASKIWQKTCIKHNDVNTDFLMQKVTA